MVGTVANRRAPWSLKATLKDTQIIITKPKGIIPVGQILPGTVTSVPHSGIQYVFSNTSQR